MIGIVVAFLIGGVLGFIGGFLFFRNNQVKLNALEDDLDEAADAAKKVVKTVSK